MLTRIQFRCVQTARGLTVEEIIAKTGIPAQAFMVLLNESSVERDPSKLISQQTFGTLEQVLGLKAGMNGLRNQGIIEWRVPQNRAGRQNWAAAVGNIRADLMGDDIRVAVMAKKRSLFGKYESAVFIHDVEANVKIVATRVDRSTERKIMAIFGEHEPRTVTVSPSEYELTCQLVANSVLRTHQFMIVVGGNTVRYTWADVEAAAKEFNFRTDDLIELMVDAVDSRNRKATEDAIETAGIPVLTAVNG